MDDASRLAERLRESVGRIVRTTRGETADGLSAAHAATLGYLDRDGAMTIAEIARRRGVRHQGQSRTVLELEDRGYARRSASDTDARASVIEITDFGRSVLDIDRLARTSWIADAIRREFTDDELALLDRVPGLLDRIAGYGDVNRQ
jgi:DNA-binding MarR family transcriptional regulator